MFNPRRNGSYRVIDIMRMTAETSNSAARTSSSFGHNRKRKLPHQADQGLGEAQFQWVFAWPLTLSILMEFPRA